MSPKVEQNSIKRRGVGLIASNPATLTPGYVLVAPLTSNQVHLIDVLGETKLTWTLPWRNGRHTRLLDNGNIGINSIDPRTDRPFWFFNKYGGGIMSEIDGPSGQIVRQHCDPLQHHDAYHYGDGSGRILYTALEQLGQDQSDEVQGGVPGSEAPDGRVWADTIKEVDGEGRILFHWKASDHLDRRTFPLQAPYPREHWPLINSVLPMSDGNILISLRSVSAVLIISRKDGSVLWHLDSKTVAQQHNATEVGPHGNILIFDNGAFRHHESFQYSRAIEVDRASKKIVWQWNDPSKERFYTPFMGGAHRLEPHGDTSNATLLTESAFGRIVEIDDHGDVSWEWINPHFAVYAEDHVRAVFPGESNALFRAYKYRPERFSWLQDTEGHREISVEDRRP